MQKRMGKKASRKLWLDYDPDEIDGYFDSPLTMNFWSMMTVVAVAAAAVVLIRIENNKAKTGFVRMKAT